MRTILFATERINASDSLDTFYFIGVLVVFAFIASSVVLHYGLADENRNKFKLALHCIMIVTSVVPPELPMELSLAVTSSLTALSRQMVFCTEPFRIPMAGKLDLLCFDKTGTLTKDQMILRGIVAPIQLPLAIHKSEFKSLASSVELDVSTIVHPSNVPDIVITCMATCHSLIQRRDGRFLGDPLEIAAMEASQCQFEVNAKTNQSSGFRGGSLPCVIHKEKNIRCQLRKRFPFTSNLKRMSVIVEVSEAGSSAATSTVVFTKGAPEVLAEFIKNLPTNYTKTYIHHMVRGKRTLALAYKPLNNKADEDLVSSEIGRFSRDEVERDLIFLGFLVFDCDLKADSKSVIKELRQSNHKLIMITGDSTHTAADVARRLGMMKSSTKLLNLQLSKNGEYDCARERNR
jgi:cation-transporting ATPase 13A1